MSIRNNPRFATNEVVPQSSFDIVNNKILAGTTPETLMQYLENSTHGPSEIDILMATRSYFLQRLTNYVVNTGKVDWKSGIPLPTSGKLNQSYGPDFAGKTHLDTSKVKNKNLGDLIYGDTIFEVDFNQLSRDVTKFLELCLYDMSQRSDLSADFEDAKNTRKIAKFVVGFNRLRGKKYPDLNTNAMTDPELLEEHLSFAGGVVIEGLFNSAAEEIKKLYNGKNIAPSEYCKLLSTIVLNSLPNLEPLTRRSFTVDTAGTNIVVKKEATGSKVQVARESLKDLLLGFDDNFLKFALYSAIKPSHFRVHNFSTFVNDSVTKKWLNSLESLSPQMRTPFNDLRVTLSYVNRDSHNKLTKFDKTRIAEYLSSENIDLSKLLTYLNDTQNEEVRTTFTKSNKIDDAIFSRKLEKIQNLNKISKASLYIGEHIDNLLRTESIEGFPLFKFNPETLTFELAHTVDEETGQRYPSYQQAFSGGVSLRDKEATRPIYGCLANNTSKITQKRNGWSGLPEELIFPEFDKNSPPEEVSIIEFFARMMLHYTKAALTREG